MWDEPIIMKLGNPGERGILVPKADEKAKRTESETLLPKIFDLKALKTSGNVSDAGTQTLYEIISGDDWNRF